MLGEVGVCSLKVRKETNSSSYVYLIKSFIMILRFNDIQKKAKLLQFLSSLDARTCRGLRVASIGRGIAHQFSCLITKVRGKVTHFSQQTVE